MLRFRPRISIKAYITSNAHSSAYTADTLTQIHMSLDSLTSELRPPPFCAYVRAWRNRSSTRPRTDLLHLLIAPITLSLSFPFSVPCLFFSFSLDWLDWSGLDWMGWQDLRCGVMWHLRFEWWGRWWVWANDDEVRGFLIVVWGLVRMTND
jgi:hypothetical protein